LDEVCEITDTTEKTKKNEGPYYTLRILHMAWLSQSLKPSECLNVGLDGVCEFLREMILLRMGMFIRTE
jgi:hypothetical protein